MKDKSGLTPFDYAVKRGAHWMVAGLQQLNSNKPKVSTNFKAKTKEQYLNVKRA